MKKGMKKIAAIVSAMAIILTMGVTSFAADTTADNTDSGRTSIWSILTDDQKSQLISDAKAKLAQELADGKITQAQYDERITAIDNGEMPFGKRGGNRGAKDNAATDTMKAKWDALTDAQKAEIYSLYDEKTAIDSKIIDKYLEFGVIDADTATTMKQNFETKKSEMRTNGRMPMPGGRGFRGDKTSTSDN